MFRTGRLKNRVSIFGGAQGFFYWSLHDDMLWGTTNLLPQDYGGGGEGCFLEGKAAETRSLLLASIKCRKL